ncbi:hypothetical protein FOA52_011816 [Chlamydomonas sp. UWO 241]|nr:hypothetical protein FOA52_011816 [Chlamydomonas sp. UWO 241]
MGCMASTPLDGKATMPVQSDAGKGGLPATNDTICTPQQQALRPKSQSVGGGPGGPKSAFSSLAEVAFGAEVEQHEWRREQIASISSMKSLGGSRSCRVSLNTTAHASPSGPPSGAASRQNSFTAASALAKRSLSWRLANMVEEKSGTLTRRVSRSMSNISNCSMIEGEGEHQGTVLLCDEEDGNTITIKKQIGKGGFGRVYLGLYNQQQVAIKAVFGERSLPLPGMANGDEVETQERRERMVQLEALLMSMLTGHPNIVHTHKCLASWRDLAGPGRGGGHVPDQGGTSIQYEWFIIMEYCSDGSLWDNLMTGTFHTKADTAAVEDVRRSSSGTVDDSNGLLRWDAWASLELLKETAGALHFLHENGVVHGDLKAANVLMAESIKDRRGWESKVTDFGFARVVHTQGHVHTKAYGTVTHQPPELLEKGLLTSSADVYSLGMLMWETYMAQGLYKELSDSEVVAKVIKERARPPFPPGCPIAYQKLAARCWAELPEARPTAEEVVAEIDELQRVMCPRGPDNEWLVVPGMVPGHRRRKKDRAEGGDDNGDTSANPNPGAAAAAAVQAIDAEQQQEAKAAKAKVVAGGGAAAITVAESAGGDKGGYSSAAGAAGYASALTLPGGRPKSAPRPKSAGARESRNVAFVPDVV